jgi:hypothetical protein
MYGNNNKAAFLEILKNLKIVSPIKTQRMIISTKPYIGERNPKNKNDHSIFNRSWMPNMDKPSFVSLFSNPLSHTK